jgi:NAD(P)-dependent dehydrogenase (short-subunit alcohol dehydrogenase family)
MALELAPTVRVIAVCPGYVWTPMQEAEYTPEMKAAVDAKIPLRRHATPARSRRSTPSSRRTRPRTSRATR